MQLILEDGLLFILLLLQLPTMLLLMLLLTQEAAVGSRSHLLRGRRVPTPEETFSRVGGRMEPHLMQGIEAVVARLTDDDEQSVAS